MKTIDYKSPQIEAFIDFIIKRHDIWYRKESHKQPAPWTDDPILQAGKFGNIWRQLDRGTRYEYDMLMKIHDQSGSALFKLNDGEIPEWMVEQFMFVCMYRHNLIPKTTELLMSNHHPELAYELMRGKPVMSDIIKIWPLSHDVASPSDMTSKSWMYYCNMHLQNVKTEATGCLELIRQRNSDAYFAFDLINHHMPRLGAFKVYEVMTSMSYLSWWPHGDQNFMYLGHGALPGLRLITGDKETPENEMHLYLPEMAYQIGVKLYFKMGMERWPHAHADVEAKFCGMLDFNVRTLEDALCEYRKYCAVKEGTRQNRPYPDNLRRWE